MWAFSDSSPSEDKNFQTLALTLGGMADGETEQGVAVSGGNRKDKWRAGGRFTETQEPYEFPGKGFCGSEKLGSQA